MLLSFFLLLLATSTVFAQKTIETWTLSSAYGGIAGTPRVVWNDNENLWVVAWRQPDPARIVSKVIKLNRKPGPLKTLITGISPSVDSFDIAYNPTSSTYLVTYETQDGLKAQRLNEQLAKEGLPFLVESSVKDAHPRLVLNSDRSFFHIHWSSNKDGVSGKVWKIRKLESTGQPASESKVLRSSAAGKQIRVSDVSLNPKNGNFFVTVTESDAASQDILGFTLDQDGNLLRKAPLVFASSSNAASAASAAFSRSGNGVGIWSQSGALRFRKLSPAGTFGAPAATVTQSTEAVSLQSDVLIDITRNRFVVTWIQNGEIQATALNSTGTAVAIPSFLVARSSSGAAQNLRSSYYPGRGMVLAVWEDSVGSQFRVRAALFFVAGFEITIRGTVELVKVYHPPLKVEDDYYYMKYHIRGLNGRQWRAYVTQETEFIGPKPRLGNSIEMEFEPGKSPTRGYIEEIRIL
jgi:hypothetical protein